jgi:hypothetical protein
MPKKQSCENPKCHHIKCAKLRVKAKRAIRKATAEKKIEPPPLHSIFYNFHPPDLLPMIRTALVVHYSRERFEGRKKIGDPLKGKELAAAVEKQMRFLHPGKVKP